MSTTEFIPLLTKAIQEIDANYKAAISELSAKNDALSTTVDLLEARLAALEAK